ncbi:hypothetical protein [Gallibacter intestinalis]|uniref:ABC transporter permease n=1 Tax=Gallibacter intestinalis TaxID=2779356 RepID=A0ABR9QVX7_9FIRM|nr:hypothetical protein [Gallibacter intestinalis]MBE5035019.1 hypothetical protein [Gallibacter intestinalis]
MNRYSSNGIFSAAILKSCLKRYMPVMFFAILYYVVIYILPEGINTGEQSFIAADTEYGTFAGIRVYSFFMPLIVSVPLFGFLHKKSATVFIHSLPFTRMQIFASTIVAGLLIINIPNIVLALYIAVAVGAKTALNALLFALLSSLFQLAICTIAAVVTGTSTMHVVMSFWFSLLPQSIYGVILLFASCFLTGFMANSNIGSVVLAMSPITSENWSFVSLSTLVYFLVSLIIYFVSALAYKRLKPERCDNAITFGWVKWVLNILAGIYMMTVIGTIFFVAYIDSFVMIVASFFGLIIGIIIGYMLLNRTFRIFKGRSLANMAIMTAIGLIFLLSFVVDIYGYEGRIPSINEVKSVKIDASGIMMDYPIEDKVMNKDYNVFNDRDVISNVVKIQEGVLDGKYNAPPSDNADWGEYRSFDITYNLKDGSTISRRYTLPYKEVDELGYIYESGEFKDQLSLSNAKMEITEFYVTTAEDAYVHKRDVTDPKHIDELIECISKDFHNRTYEEEIDYTDNLGLHIEYYDFYSDYINVRDCDTNTIDFLLEKGYIEKVK